MKEENKEYLTAQIITYIGNKRQLIRNIEEEVKKIAGLLGKEKLVCADCLCGYFLRFGNCCPDAEKIQQCFNCQ